MWTFDCGWAVYFELAYLFELYIAVIGFDLQQFIQLPFSYVKNMNLQLDTVLVCRW